MRRHQWPFGIVGIGVVCTLLAATVSLQCAGDSGSSPGEQLSEGKRLMQKHCSTCHLPVSAASLDKETWLNGVLPAMAPKLGINVLWENEYYPDKSAPPDSSISMEDWLAIVEYFRREAPDTLRVPEPPATLQSDVPGFSVRTPQWDRDRRPAATSMVEIDSAGSHIYSADATAGTIHRWNERLVPSSIDHPGLVGVDVAFVGDTSGSRHAVFTSIGTMRAVNARNGTVWDLNLATDSSRMIAQQLPRPVRSVPGDFNNDGLRDWIVCGFGHTIGGLYLFEQQPDHSFEKQTLRGVPGAVDAHTGDFNGDGWLDVVVLFAHGDEGIWMFTNDQTGGFTSRNLLRFPPVYGSNSFQLADFNEDGQLDILYTAGDNADYSTILKPYHGIYLFLNRGDYQYEQAYFYHFDGATEAIAADFDEDGDLDIGAIGFFADLKDESAKDFVYLEQTEPMAFTPHAPPIQHYGRWISMDAGDVDGDGDRDFALGNYARRYLNRDDVEADSTAHIPFIVLENELR